ncbi:hypothetical protein PI95_005325 [Hassallia byssoidea VB512170]|uniref:Uncharacterized protein n=1 Tax=Hassallia byssoidea VB512170 TaxID=1304833 RepID=A0A846H308_9CYAN|nr:hypothetical protein [Hassalia byssoidea]NEU72007.1 hypothetical protein [Hassalia byssoidea VB512170]
MDRRLSSTHLFQVQFLQRREIYLWLTYSANHHHCQYFSNDRIASSLTEASFVCIVAHRKSGVRSRSGGFRIAFEQVYIYHKITAGAGFEPADPHNGGDFNR